LASRQHKRRKLLSALFGTFLTTALSAAQLSAWGWRPRFLFGLLVGPIGLYIRRHVQETPEFVAITPVRAPARQVLSTANLRLLLGTGIGAAPMGITSFFVYLPTFAVQELRLPLHAAFYTLMLSPCLAVVANLTLADLSDKVGRIQMMLPACVLSLISIYSVCALLVHHKSVPVLLLAVGSRCTKRHPC
jgi:MFS transporter, MHS family, proline/betaine transporter